MNLIRKYLESFVTNKRNVAFYDGEKICTYEDFSIIISGIRHLIETDKNFMPETPIGVVCYDDVYTYASIFAAWFSGCSFVPLNPAMPAFHNNEIVLKQNLKIILSSQLKTSEPGYPQEVILTQGVQGNNELPIYEWAGHQVVYVLTTSGSTGTPKYVPINLNNLTAFVQGFMEMYPELNESDIFLQTYDLTADAAFTGYMVPLLIGASVSTISNKLFKPFAVSKVLSSMPVTWVQVTPSLLACLAPFFSSFNLHHIRHFHFGGEALPASLVELWRKSVPNAEISNVYGPTETSVTATIYKCLPGERLKSMNNIVSIGKPLKKVSTRIKTDLQGVVLGQGELLIAGPQVMECYLYSENQPFQYIDEPAGTVKYYPTGDLVSMDTDGNLYFIGRLNDQVKINGYRVDLIEVENCVRELLPVQRNVAAIAVKLSPGLSRLIVFIENFDFGSDKILSLMNEKLPPYKIPEKIIGVKSFPLLSSGKTDKRALVDNFLTGINHDCC